MLAIWSTTIQALSLTISPQAWGYWRFAGLAVLVLSTATVILLGIVARRVPEERPRDCRVDRAAALDTGSRRLGWNLPIGLDPMAGLYSRYITISMPVLGVL